MSLAHFASAGLSPFASNFAFGLSPHLAPTMALMLLASTQSTFEPAVNETPAGYMVTANIPGVPASDCAVSFEPGADDSFHARLKLRAPPHLQADLRLPSRLIDPSKATASCIDGVLSVAIPKIPPTETDIPVSATRLGPKGSLSADYSSDDYQDIIALRVPGFASTDVSVKAIYPDRTLEVRGSSEHFGRFQRSYQIPAGAEAKDLSAACADGILTIRVDRHTSAPVQVPVSADPPPPTDPTTASANSDDNTPPLAAAAAAADRVTLITHAVPGVSAGHIAVEVGPDRVVRATAAAPPGPAGRRGRKTALAHRLPAGVDPASIQAHCAHGVLTVTHAAPTLPERRSVDVSAAVPAALPANDARDAAHDAAEDAPVSDADADTAASPAAAPAAVSADDDSKLSAGEKWRVAGAAAAAATATTKATTEAEPTPQEATIIDA